MWILCWGIVFLPQVIKLSFVFLYLLVFKFAIGIFQFIWNWFWCVVWGKDLISFVFCRGSQLFKHLLLTIYLPTPDLQSVICSHSTRQYVSDFRFGSGWSISELIAHSQVSNAFWCLRGTSFFFCKSVSLFGDFSSPIYISKSSCQV